MSFKNFDKAKVWKLWPWGTLVSGPAALLALLWAVTTVNDVCGSVSNYTTCLHTPKTIQSEVLQLYCQSGCFIFFLLYFNKVLDKGQMLWCRCNCVSVTASKCKAGCVHKLFVNITFIESFWERMFIWLRGRRCHWYNMFPLQCRSQFAYVHTFSGLLASSSYIISEDVNQFSWTSSDFYDCSQPTTLWIWNWIFSMLHATHWSNHQALINVFWYAASDPHFLIIWKLIIILSYTQLRADMALLNISEECGYLLQTICLILLFPPQIICGGQRQNEIETLWYYVL